MAIAHKRRRRRRRRRRCSFFFNILTIFVLNLPESSPALSYPHRFRFCVSDERFFFLQFARSDLFFLPIQCLDSPGFFFYGTRRMRFRRLVPESDVTDYVPITLLPFNLMALVLGGFYGEIRNNPWDFRSTVLMLMKLAPFHCVVTRKMTKALRSILVSASPLGSVFYFNWRTPSLIRSLACHIIQLSESQSPLSLSLSRLLIRQ